MTHNYDISSITVFCYSINRKTSYRWACTLNKSCCFHNPDNPTTEWRKVLWKAGCQLRDLTITEVEGKLTRIAEQLTIKKDLLWENTSPATYHRTLNHINSTLIRKRVKLTSKKQRKLMKAVDIQKDNQLFQTNEDEEMPKRKKQTFQKTELHKAETRTLE